MLVIRGLDKTYANGVHALHDVNLDIPRGMFGLLGPNGAGKSTLMRILATLQSPDIGSVHLGELDALKEPARVRQSLGYLPQRAPLYTDMSVYEYLRFVAEVRGLVAGEGEDVGGGGVVHGAGVELFHFGVADEGDGPGTRGDFEEFEEGAQVAGEEGGIRGVGELKRDGHG